MYKAIVSAISVRPHPNADRLQLGLVHGYQVIVGLDVKDGDVGVFFPTDGELSHEMCLENDLYNESAANELKLEPWPISFGFFGVKRRVRAQKFRGEKSDGFWCELEKLAWTGTDLADLKVGDTIDSLNGQIVCQKYYSPATLRAMKGGTKSEKKYTEVIFPKHKDTDQLRYYLRSIPAGSLITITEKLHGTSGRFGHVFETTELRGLAWVWDKLKGGTGSKTRWVHLNGSKNVVLREETEDTNPGWYGTNEFRYNVTRNLTLLKGEVVYFEIVGDVRETVPIMPSQPIDPSLKEARKLYGDVMHFRYGQPPGTHTLYVYRITRLTPEGVETELSWSQVKARSRELGLKVVPELTNQFVFNGLSEELEGVANLLMDGQSILDSTQMREGVVVRVENDLGTYYYKSKSFLFGVLEGYLKTNDESIDPEDIS